MTDLRLALDGSTYAGSCSVLRGNAVIAERALPPRATKGRGGGDEEFLPMVVDCLGEAGIRASDLVGVICGGGPGSFTSLRVAASIAKGIAVGTGCPLFAVSSLRLIVASHATGPGLYLAALPAMRGEVFVADVEVGDSGEVSERGRWTLMAESALATEARRRSAIAVGPAVAPGQTPRASAVSRILPAILDAGACSIETWEPDYGRLAEAQVRWEAAHGRSLSAAR